MVNPRQRRKARSSAHKTVKHSRHAKRNHKKMKPIRGPKALQDAWDKKKTLRQNYAAMGLVGSLKQADSGGSERPQADAIPVTPGEAGPSIPSAKSKSEGAIPPRYGKILRDADGNVVGVELPEEDDDEEEEEEEDAEMAGHAVPNIGRKTEVVNALEKLAEASRPVQRWSSGGEVAALKRLVAKHGRDFEAMAKDRQVNAWQRTAGQLQRAIKKAGL